LADCPFPSAFLLLRSIGVDFKVRTVSVAGKKIKGEPLRLCCVRGAF